MVEITEATSIEELAVIISEALETTGIPATFSGGRSLPWASPKVLPSGSMNIPAPSGWLSFRQGPLNLETGLWIIDPLVCCKPSTVLYG